MSSTGHQPLDVNDDVDVNWDVDGGAAARGRSGAAADRRVRRRITVIWSLLFLNGMPYTFGILPIPRQVGQLVSAVALALAILLALTLNRRLLIRANVVLALLTVLCGTALLASLRFLAGPGAVLRSFRLVAFVGVLWLLSPWWGRRDLLLVRCHLRALLIALGTVVVGLLVAPGLARPGGRLTGVLWSIPPPQVAQYAGVAAGIALTLWMSGRLGRSGLAIAVSGLLIVLLTQTRTAIIALAAGVLCASLSLFLSRSRVRRTARTALIVVPVAAVALAPAFITWFNRNQTAAERGALTGRKVVWDALLNAPRTELTRWLGSGLSDKSFNGLPIDSTWLALYQDEGIIGMVLVAIMLLTLFVMLLVRPPGPGRAVAAFIVVYCTISSYTEVGLGDASPYMLSLIVATSLLVREQRGDALEDATVDRTAARVSI